ncbi:MAG TPA: hypothetical protein VK177_04645 [Flavobacteriales bacterium]|nr:hypothetical protein [Flavobacteriales bacterium]
MIKDLDIVVPPETAYDPLVLKQFVSQHTRIKLQEIKAVVVKKRSIDARSKYVKINLRVSIYINELPVEEKPDFPGQNVSNAKEVHIIGAGPAGLFAALQLIANGFKPVIFERGKNVSDRRRDLAALTKNHIVNPDSNYCFGEGGAGTYSDGKLYTRSTKRGSVDTVLEWLVYHGAGNEIKVDAHPHIGTNKLPGIIENIRQTILDCGGEIHFNSRITAIESKNGAVSSVTLNDAQKINCTSLIIATGHSARDIFELFHENKWEIEYKPFAIGVRAEHPQTLIDQIQYKCEVRYPELPAASYSVVEQVNNLGVYSFCMCPGGIIAPCATAPGEVVTNGWSPSKRNNPFANSGIVVAIDEKDLVPFEKHGALKGLKYQQLIEQTAWAVGGKTQVAPAQRMVDFCERKVSSSLPDCSYIPGITSASLYDVLPDSISQRLNQAFKKFGEKMKGYYTNDAVLVGVESRTSSPVRIPRKPDTLEHVQIKGIYPCGEGAGYAGGIVSAAIDGMNCAGAIGK